MQEPRQEVRVTQVLELAETSLLIIHECWGFCLLCYGHSKRQELAPYLSLPSVALDPGAAPFLCTSLQKVGANQ